jgi:hypothetical protein
MLLLVRPILSTNSQSYVNINVLILLSIGKFSRHFFEKKISAKFYTINTTSEGENAENAADAAAAIDLAAIEDLSAFPEFNEAREKEFNHLIAILGGMDYNYAITIIW